MSAVIGLGSVGTALANEFKKYPQYVVYSISVGDKRTYGKKTYIKEQRSAEQYEDKCPSMRKFLKGVKGDILFVVDGAELVSAATLKILSYVKHCDINILYICSESKFLSKEERLNEVAVRGVLQEYARSAVFNKMMLVDIPIVGATLSDLTVKTYHSKIREAIVSTLHMVEVFSRTSPDLGSQREPHEAARLVTIGCMDMSTGKENMFFPLNYPREKYYYYAINENKLETDSTLLGKINEQVSKGTHENLHVSYGIYSTEYAEDYVYVVSRSSAIQK